jgi:hypothetical protein
MNIKPSFDPSSDINRLRNFIGQGQYEPSTSLYRSRFVKAKKEGNITKFEKLTLRETLMEFAMRLLKFKTSNVFRADALSSCAGGAAANLISKSNSKTKATASSLSGAAGVFFQHKKETLVGPNGNPAIEINFSGTEENGVKEGHIEWKEKQEDVKTTEYRGFLVNGKLDGQVRKKTIYNDNPLPKDHINEVEIWKDGKLLK